MEYSKLPAALRDDVTRLEVALARQILPGETTPMSTVSNALTWVVLRPDVAATCFTSEQVDGLLSVAAKQLYRRDSRTFYSFLWPVARMRLTSA